VAFVYEFEAVGIRVKKKDGIFFPLCLVRWRKSGGATFRLIKDGISFPVLSNDPGIYQRLAGDCNIMIRFLVCVCKFIY
jgi:hypothetical protein